MKKNSLSLVALAGLMVVALSAPAFAGEGKALTTCGAGKAVTACPAGKVVTIHGEGKCSKCALHETDKCQSVIQTQENGQTVTYYLAKNAASKKCHAQLCKKPQKVTATGTVKEANGKKVLTASNVELAK